MKEKPKGFILHRYAKDKEGKRIGCFAALVDEVTGELRAGWSKLHKLDYGKPFNREKTKMIAEQRAMKVSKVTVPNKITPQYMKFVLDAEYEFGRSVDYPKFNSKTFDKVKAKWEENQKKWLEKEASKGQVTSPTSDGVTTTTQSSE
jgi:hypothetical protein